MLRPRRLALGLRSSLVLVIFPPRKRIRAAYLATFSTFLGLDIGLISCSEASTGKDPIF